MGLNKVCMTPAMTINWSIFVDVIKKNIRYLYTSLTLRIILSERRR